MRTKITLVDLYEKEKVSIKLKFKLYFALGCKLCYPRTKPMKYCIVISIKLDSTKRSKQVLISYWDLIVQCPLTPKSPLCSFLFSILPMKHPSFLLIVISLIQFQRALCSSLPPEGSPVKQVYSSWANNIPVSEQTTCIDIS